MRSILGLIIAVFVSCFGLYLFSLLPDLFVNFKHFMLAAGGICCVGGGVILGILCVVDLLENGI